jgi:hypothetical protein
MRTILFSSMRIAVLTAALASPAIVCAATPVTALPPSHTAVIPLTGMGESGEAPVYWDFRIDAGRRAGEWTRIRVPSNWEQEGFGTYYYGTQGRNRPDSDPIIPKEQGEYRTHFDVPAEWRGRQVRIVFEGTMTDTKVSINGHSAGEIHQGGFYRFDYDITGLVVFGGKNLLEVTVSKESSNASVNRAERRGDYWTFGGIYRPVWLEARPVHHIEWTALDARADGTFYAQVHLNTVPPEGSTVSAHIYDASGAAVGAPISVRVAANRNVAIVRSTLRNPRTWSAEHPHLYRAHFALHGPDRNGARDQSETLHEVNEPFGFRTFEVRPRDGLYLNGSKIVLKGINRHSFRPATGRALTREDSYADARRIKEANMNAVRMSHYPPDKHFLQAADELGLYVLHELAGWQGAYDTPTAARLIGQLVRRDVNHPSVLFWDNGNEGGWNREVDGEFDRWDPQRRPVLHPWAIHSGVNTDHYEKYESTVKLSAGPDIFMPTEFLHGLYDGGIGAGLEDYWRVMSSSPTVAGGFFWVFADESIQRTDRNGQLDSVGNAAPDGILGPNGEKEGSFFTVKEIWSPVQINALRVDASKSALLMSIRNDYAFTDLSRHSFSWKAVRLPRADAPNAQRAIAGSGTISGPDLRPGQQRPWRIALPRKVLANYDVLHLTATDPTGHEVWTWSLPREVSASNVASAAMPDLNSAAAVSGEQTIIESAPFTLTFDNKTGLLREVRKGKQVYPLSNGPRLLAYRRKERRFEAIGELGNLLAFQVAEPNVASDVLATARYDGPLQKITWSRSGDALLLSYQLAYEGVVDIFGIQFDMPESALQSKRWVGRGPYRVWQNRLKGGIFDLHEVRYNDPVPGETYAYPEFKGYFGEWQWLELATTSGRIIVENVGAVPYFGLQRPQGGANPVLDLPDVGLAFLSVIPAMGTKFDEPVVLGPQSQPRHLSGMQHGSVRFRFD